ncbi:MAG: hypothetical protein ACD_5C00095G0004 [uncultured bacterium]|nr:MAG: hypothetical protein ACD_5C00095G0004 [uncultured bacterium]
MEKMKHQLPEMTMHSNEMPEVKEMQIGKKYKMVVEMEVTKMGKGEEYGGIMMENGKEVKETGMFARCKVVFMKMMTEKPDTLKSFAAKKAAVHDNRKM